MAQNSLDLAKESSVQEILAKASPTGSVVKSIQRGVINITGDVKTGTATITEVDPNKSVILFGGSVGDGDGGNGDSGNWDARLDLTSSTVVTATIYYSYSYTNTTVSWQVVEFY